MKRIESQIQFILELDKLKSVLRRSYLVNGERRENSAEHSWHIAMMAMVLAEHANEPVDVCRVVKMLLVHDIVEIDADDTFCYDEIGALDKERRETEAAARIFGILPADQQAEISQLWHEFEARETVESRFATALDRLMPLLHNAQTQGKSWQENNVKADQVFAKNAHITEGSSKLWEFAQSVINEAVTQGHLPTAAL